MKVQHYYYIYLDNFKTSFPTEYLSFEQPALKYSYLLLTNLAVTKTFGRQGAAMVWDMLGCHGMEWDEIEWIGMGLKF